jgi:hypothetical protein
MTGDAGNGSYRRFGTVAATTLKSDFRQKASKLLCIYAAELLLKEQ